ncbi:unnamed protein product, partial [Prorocentrum cordatum]
MADDPIEVLRAQAAVESTPPEEMARIISSRMVSGSDSAAHDIEVTCISAVLIEWPAVEITSAAPVAAAESTPPVAATAVVALAGLMMSIACFSVAPRGGAVKWMVCLPVLLARRRRGKARAGRQGAPGGAAAAAEPPPAAPSPTDEGAARGEEACGSGAACPQQPPAAGRAGEPPSDQLVLELHNMSDADLERQAKRTFIPFSRWK